MASKLELEWKIDWRDRLEKCLGAFAEMSIGDSGMEKSVLSSALGFIWTLFRFFTKGFAVEA